MLLITLSLGLGHKIESKAAGTVSPAWMVDLRTVGFTGFAPKNETLHFRPNPLCFSDSKTLIATFITREDVTTLTRRDDSVDARPNRLHGIFLDAQTGNVQSTKEWSVPHPRGGIIPAGDGRFIVLTTAMITSYSQDLQFLKEYRLSAEQQSHLRDFYSSPTGKSIVANYHYSETFLQWIDTDSLQAGPIAKAGFPGGSISDEAIIWSRETYDEPRGFVNEVIVRPRNGADHVICRSIFAQGQSCGQPEFLSNDLLALWMPHGFRVVTKTSGDSLLSVSFREDEWLALKFYPSADSKRFAVSVWAHKGGSAFLDIDYRSVLKRILVYDIPSRQLVYTLDAKRSKIKTFSGLALSPDGSLMAILADGVVELYQLSSS